jgi:hypothetical protein
MSAPDKKHQTYRDIDAFVIDDGRVFARVPDVDRIPEQYIPRVLADNLASILEMWLEQGGPGRVGRAVATDVLDTYRQLTAKGGL